MTFWIFHSRLLLHSFNMCLFTWLKRLAGEVPLFFHFVPFCFLFPSLLSFVLFFLFDLLPARRRDNILDKPSTDKWMPAAALQRGVLLRVADHFVPHIERKTEREGERDVGCLSALACGICDCSSEPFASIHFWESLPFRLLPCPNTATKIRHVFFWTQTHILYMCMDCVQHGTLPIFLVPVMTKTFVKTIHYVDIPMHPAIICFEQALGDIKTCSLVFWLLWFQKARTIPLSNYYLWHRSTHYIDSQVNNKSFHNNGANIKFVFPLSF